MKRGTLLHLQGLRKGSRGKNLDERWVNPKMGYCCDLLPHPTTKFDG
jgi:hypothetical protein